MLHEVRDARSQKGIIEKEYEKFLYHYSQFKCFFILKGF